MLKDPKIGDKIVAIHEDRGLGEYEVGDILTVVREHGGNYFILGDEIEIEALTSSAFSDDNVELFAPADDLAHGFGIGYQAATGDRRIISGSGNQLGVARPILETRKIGKDQMHMVSDGFPLALRHLAQIMTWAADVKQYKLHDWRNLPNPAVEFPSAEYRHANDNSIQKAEGLRALERVDHESGKLHIGHKVFNALCELELVLRGDIK